MAAELAGEAEDLEVPERYETVDVPIDQRPELNPPGCSVAVVYSSRPIDSSEKYRQGVKS